jgi:uncharacterized protein
MSKNFVSDPREVVKPGDVVRVRVLSVDIGRKRISLTLRLDDDEPQARRPSGQPRPERSHQDQPRQDRGRPGQPRGEQSRDGRPRRDGQPRDGQSRGGRPGGNSQPANDAMADALRRAGLTGDTSKPGNPNGPGNPGRGQRRRPK